MGLDTTHGCWSGGYGSFNRWRETVATAAGYCVAKMRDSHGAQFDSVALDWDVFKPENYQGEWDADYAGDPLLFLLVHSDCDGVIHPAQARKLADRLERIRERMPRSWDKGGQLSDVRNATSAFIDGLRAAAAAGEDVEFH